MEVTVKHVRPVSNGGPLIPRRLYKNQSERAYSDLGYWYITDRDRAVIVAGHVDPVALAREMGVLRPFEEAEGF